MPGRRQRVLWRVALVVATWGSAASLVAAEAESLPRGTGSIRFVPDPQRPQESLRVWTCRPDRFGPESPIVVVMHGVQRNGQGYRDVWAPHSREQGFLLLVPEFPEAQFPEEKYQQGNLRDEAGRPRPPEQWTYAILEQLFDHVRQLADSRVEKYYLYGHSAGGQFVHRFVLFMPQARYARAIAANPGYYTFPTSAAEYPYGLRGTHLAGSVSPAVFARDFVLLLGEDDVLRDGNLRQTPEADAQGLTRKARGENFFAAAKKQAVAQQAPFQWRLQAVSGAGHSNAQMAGPAAKALFAEK